MPNEVPDQDRWLRVIGRALSYLCIHATDLREAELTPKALLLGSFGLPRSDIAALLGTTEDTVRVSVNTAKREKKRAGRKKKK
ncbi:MAG TPA: hypothetical protein VGQ93_04180 [Lysobacter sp.]|jgi:hypothetical protein|nr:hypothetical protein [Lysobacter sp.]